MDKDLQIQLYEIEALQKRINGLESTIATFKYAPVSFIQLDLKGNLHYANNQGEELYAIIKALPIYNTLKTESSEAFTANLITVKEYVIDEQFYECQFVPIIDLGLINICLINITDRKDTEAKLRKSEYRYRKIIETASDIVYRSSPDGFFKYANPIAIRKMKYSLEELKHKRFTELILKEHVQKAEEFYLRQFKNKIPNTYYEFPVKAKDGEIYWLGQHVQAIVEDGYIKEFLAVARDITEEKQAKEEMLIAKKKAEESAKAKEQFLANMSHEIRTPLNVIMGMANLLKSEKLEDTSKQYLNAILNSSSNLLVIINDILDLTKVEMGGMLIEHIPFDFKELINVAIASNKLKADEKALTLKADIDEKIDHTVIGDPTRLNQVLLNLLNNAVKFTTKGTVHLECELLSRDSEEDLIGFKVSDTGIGIAEENLEKIFESFTQEDASVTRKFGGTGLGLAISKKIVGLLGGELKVKSKKGEGTTFSFELPFKRSKESKESILLSGKKHDFQYVKILVAEDNEFNQLLIKAMLKKNKFNFRIVNNGEEVIQSLQAENYDLILMDMQMPVMGGEETVLKIKNSEWSHIPIIALTANALSGDREKYLASGVDDYIAKPFNEIDLLETISKLLIKEKP